MQESVVSSKEKQINENFSNLRTFRKSSVQNANFSNSCNEHQLFQSKKGPQQKEYGRLSCRYGRLNMDTKSIQNSLQLINQEVSYKFLYLYCNRFQNISGQKSKSLCKFLFIFLCIFIIKSLKYFSNLPHMQGQKKQFDQSKQFEAVTQKFNSMGIESSIDQLIEFNDTSLQSIVQIIDVIKSGNREIPKNIFDQMIEEESIKRSKTSEQIDKSKSKKSGSFIEDELFFRRSNRSGSAMMRQEKTEMMMRSGDEKYHECFCANSNQIACKICSCLLTSQPCVINVCCNHCFVLKHHHQFQIQKRKIESCLNQGHIKIGKSSSQKVETNPMDIQKYVFQNGYTKIHPNQQAAYEKVKQDEEKDKNTGKKQPNSSKIDSSPGKNKPIHRIESGSKERKGNKKERSRRKIFSQTNKNLPKTDYGNKIYPILSEEKIQEEISQKQGSNLSPTLNNKKKGLGITLKSEDKIETKQKKAQTPSKEYICHCNQMDCLNLYCKCFKFGYKCSDRCLCAGCKNGFHSTKKSDQKPYLQNSGNGINHIMEFVPVIFTTSQDKTVKSSNKSVRASDNESMRRSENKSCECEEGRCVWKKCPCFSGRKDCGVGCKCSAEVCQNRRNRMVK